MDGTLAGGRAGGRPQPRSDFGSHQQLPTSPRDLWPGGGERRETEREKRREGRKERREERVER